MAAGDEVTVWDPLVRVFHWTLVAAVSGAILWEDPRLLHEALGWTAAGLVAVRTLWGFVGTSHARFADFVPTPRRLGRYLGDLARGREPRFLGHNPAGAVMVLALMATIAVLGWTGWAMGSDGYFGVDWVEETHESAANGLLLLVALHIGGVIVESLRHGDNLIAAMITGRKRP